MADGSPLDLDAMVAHLSGAIRDLTAAGQPREAAMACAQLGDVFESLMGNLTAARAWYARATRLVEDLEPCVEQGWVAVAAMGCDVGDPDALLSAAELALDRARTFGDVNLETKALADGGLAHVQAGRIDTGMAMLDEAMALACSAADDTTTAAKSACSMFTACYHAADFARADSWAVPLRRRGLIGQDFGGPIYLSTHCDSVRAALLCELGQWGEAEAVLERACAEWESVMHSPSWHPTVALADLRIRQGRAADAEALLLGKDAYVGALLPMARLHLLRGDLDLARATARRGLRLLADDCLRAAELLAVLVEADLACGEIDAARRSADELARRAALVDVKPVRARAAIASARVAAAAGSAADAIADVQRMADELAGAGLLWIEAAVLLELASLRLLEGDRVGAMVDAKAARGILAPLDVVLSPRHVAVLEQLRDERTAGTVAVLHRDARGWHVEAGGIRARVPDTKGVRYLAELLRSPGTERHALDLVDAVEGVGDVDRRGLGDAGELADAQARAAYRRRIERLRDEIDDALAVGNEEGALRLQEELDALVHQLAAAFGIGGRARRAGDVAERARLNVTRAIRSALARLADDLPEAAATLDRGVRTGLYCAYEPDAEDRIRWIVQS